MKRFVLYISLLFLITDVFGQSSLQKRAENALRNNEYTFAINNFKSLFSQTEKQAGSGHAAEDSAEIKRIPEYFRKHGGNEFDMCKDNDQSDHYIEQSHEGHDHFSQAQDPLPSAK